MGPGQPIEQPTGPAEPEQSLAELPTRTFTRQQPVEPPWEGPPMDLRLRRERNPEGNDLNRTPSEDNASERDAAGQTSSNSGPEAGPSITVALHRTRTRATAPSEASAGYLERHMSEDDDREGPRPDPVSDPRWEAAIRARGMGTPINRGDPGTGAIATTTGGTTGSAEYARHATGGPDGTEATVRAADGTNGPTQAGIRQGTTRVRGSAVQSAVALAPEPSTDLEVNGPYWDSHVVDVVPESDEDARTRVRLMHQASRRVIHRGRNSVDQQLILAPQNQVDREHDRAVAVTEELERFQQGAREMRDMQRTHRANSVRHIANLRQNINTLQLRIRELEAQIVRLEHVAAGLRDDNKTAQLLIAHHKASVEEAAELDRQGSSRMAQERQQSEREIHALHQTIGSRRNQEVRADASRSQCISEEPC